MSATVFFSWQSDTPKRDGRNFIERAIDKALKNLSKDIGWEEAERPEIDQDTKNVPGSPKIFDTLLQNIEASALFVPDFTFVGKRDNGEPMPNPNVLIEYGYARKCKKLTQIIPVMNVAYGKPTRVTLPFDLLELRNPILYDLRPDTDEETWNQEFREFEKKIYSELRLFFESGEYRKLLGQPEAITYRAPVDGEARFREKGKPIGTNRDQVAQLIGAEGFPVYLDSAPAMWLRVMPKFPVQRRLKITAISSAIQGLIVLPFMGGATGNILVRDEDGCGYCKVLDQKEACMAMFLFTDGEIWLIDAWHLGRLPKLISLNEKDYIDSLSQCAHFLRDRFGIPGPYRWVAGVEDTRNRYLSPRDEIGGTFGPCSAPEIIESGEFTIGESPQGSLEPFFDKIFDQCNVKRMPHSPK